MRRTLASLLLALWMASACAPLLQAQSVPACCRAHGKHHCAMHSQGDGFHVAPCSLYQQHSTALTLPFANALGVQSRFAIAVVHGQASPALLAPYISHFHAGDIQKRGPPLA